ncbi:uncharacterized protein LOC114410685 [Glycine soja]|uniref:uncharacterized protein LOC114410685 n=1 Tax=Glycine soja TaxID=3848 RepID=UPI00103F540C|nr:uncharacterized protein LOC114410685 [Glycine soja]
MTVVSKLSSLSLRGTNPKLLSDDITVDPIDLDSEQGTDHPGCFRFSVGCDNTILREVVEEVRMVWNVVLRGWRGVFTMMEHVGKVGFVPDGEGWFSQELPMSGCCFGAVVVDLKVGMCEADGENVNQIRVNEVSVGILSIVD